MSFSHITLLSFLILGGLLFLIVFIFRKNNYFNLSWPFGIAFFIFGIGYHFILWDTYMMPQGKLALLIPIGLSLPISILSFMFKPFGFCPFLCSMTILGSLQYYYIGSFFTKK